MPIWSVIVKTRLKIVKSINIRSVVFLVLFSKKTNKISNTTLPNIIIGMYIEDPLDILNIASIVHSIAVKIHKICNIFIFDIFFISIFNC
jgi:hypothetical protein